MTHTSMMQPGRADQTEAQRLTHALATYLTHTSDEEAFLFGQYSELDRQQTIRPTELAQKCARLIDPLLEATGGAAKIKSKTALEAAVLETLSRNPSRQICTTKPRHELCKYIVSQVYGATGDYTRVVFTSVFKTSVKQFLNYFLNFG